ncbi:MAG: hypothetical protein IJP86_06265 [Synergistaceae bacterium]|nr:hypothetical protein [Synergistaceae bacterium]
MNTLHILRIYQRLCDDVGRLSFSYPAEFVYNPLSYAWDGFRQYAKFSEGRKRVVFVGINPGPWGMAQTGIPFGEVNSVREFLGITSIRVFTPQDTHVSYPVHGLDCGRSEVSGKRLWGLFREKFGKADNFFASHFVLNYCPLLFLGRTDAGSIRNLTPDKLNPPERDELCRLCDDALIEAVEILRPDYVIGIGTFAFQRAKSSLQYSLAYGRPDIIRILHPSPANPRANKDWAGQVTRQLSSLGVWE